MFHTKTTKLLRSITYGYLVAEEILKRQQARIKSFVFQIGEGRDLDFTMRQKSLFKRISLSHLCSFWVSKGKVPPIFAKKSIQIVFDTFVSGKASFSLGDLQCQSTRYCNAKEHITAARASFRKLLSPQEFRLIRKI